MVFDNIDRGLLGFHAGNAILLVFWASLRVCVYQLWLCQEYFQGYFLLKPTANFNLDLLDCNRPHFLLLMIFVFQKFQGRNFFVKQLPVTVTSIDLVWGDADLIGVNQELYLIVIRMTWLHQTAYYLFLVFYGLLDDEHLPVLSVSISANN